MKPDCVKIIDVPSGKISYVPALLDRGEFVIFGHNGETQRFSKRNDAIAYARNYASTWIKRIEQKDV